MLKVAEHHAETCRNLLEQQKIQTEALRLASSNLLSHSRYIVFDAGPSVNISIFTTPRLKRNSPNMRFYSTRFLWTSRLLIMYMILIRFPFILPSRSKISTLENLYQKPKLSPGWIDAGSPMVYLFNQTN
jgi:hypothetical protein